MTHANAICWLCGKFMSYQQMADGVEWTPYGSTLGDEPPPSEYAHKPCWDKAEGRRRMLIRSTAYIKPNYMGEVV